MAAGDLELDSLNLSIQTDIDIDKNYLAGLPNVSQMVTMGYESEGWILLHLDIKGDWKKPMVELKQRK